jgi:hypothetical protein
MRVRLFYLLLIFLVLMLSVIACGAEETAIPESTATPIPPTINPTPTIDWFPRTPTPTPQIPTSPQQLPPTPSKPISSDLITSDDFSDPEIWQTSSGTPGTVAYEPDALSLAVAGGKNSLVSLSTHELPSEFYLEINLDAQMCSPEDQFGLILWNNSSSGTFRVWFSCSGQVMMDRVLPSGTTVLQKWQIARKFQVGSPAFNRIGVRSVNNSLEVYVNETHQFTYTPLNKLSGALGVIAQSGGDHAMTIRVSDLQILNP